MSSPNNNNSVRGPRVTLREESILNSMLKNLTRDAGTVLNHINGAAKGLRDELFVIHVGCKLLMERFDGHSIAVYDDPGFKKLAKEVFRRICSQGPGRKIFLTTVSSPHMGLDCHYFAYYLTTRTITQSDLQLMTPFIEKLELEAPSIIMDPAVVTVGPPSDDDTIEDIENEVANVIIFGPETKENSRNMDCQPPVIPFSPVRGPEPILVKDLPATAKLIKQSTVDTKPVDEFGFWTGENSDFDDQVNNLNQTINANNGKSETVEQILDEIFSPKYNAKSFNCSCKRSVSNMTANLSVDNELPDEIRIMSPIRTSPNVSAVRPTPQPAKQRHRLDKSRLTGRRGRRQHQQHQQQQRRNSFDDLPHNRDTVRVQMNATVPSGQHIEDALNSIINRLDKLETSINKKKVNFQRYPRNRQTLPRYTPPQFFNKIE